MSKISVMIVDDSAFMRSVIRDILQKNPEIEIIDEASDGEEALTKLNNLNPDVVTLDLEMPKKNGISVLSQLMSWQKNTKVLIVSSYTTENSAITLDCLRMGATDFILKPSEKDSVDFERFSKNLAYKVMTTAKAQRVHASEIEPSNSFGIRYSHRVTNGVVVIGSSTGGPVALETLLPEIPEEFACPILVAQHLPEQFVSTLASRIRSKSSLEVVVAQTGQEIGPGTIYFIPGGHDGVVERVGISRVQFSIVENKEEILTPSVDKLMLSAVNVYRKNTIGVILTGMGKDGLLGVREIKQAGGVVIVQDKETSAVFGMGREVVEAKLADYVVPLATIARIIEEVVGNG